MIKKRKKIIAFISSILTCTALCGFFALSSFGSKKQKVECANAVNIDLYSGSGIYTNTKSYIHRQGSLDSNYYFNDGNITLNIDYSYLYYSFNDGDYLKYQFRLDFTLWFYFDNVTTTNMSGIGYTDWTGEHNLYSSIGRTYDDASPERYRPLTYTFLTEASTTNVYNFNCRLLFNTDDLNSPYLTVSLNEASFVYMISSIDGVSPQLLNLRSLNFSDRDFYTLGRNIAMESYSGNTLSIFNDNINYVLNDYDAGQQVGYETGYNQGYNDGSISGYNQGYNEGYQSGFNEGEDVGDTLLQDAYTQGFNAGYNEGSSEDATVTSIFNGITTVALVPIRFFLNIFNFEILGVNIASVVSALMSICLILIVWRAVMGGKSND